jgi:hypothetical protein
MTKYGKASSVPQKGQRSILQQTLKMPAHIPSSTLDANGRIIKSVKSPATPGKFKTSNASNIKMKRK